MALDWERMFKRYVIDDARTPHFIRVSKLSKTQAHYEILFYALLVVPVCIMLGVASLSGKLPHGDAPMVAMYALAVAWATIVFAWSKNQIAAAFSATMPLALLLYFALFGFPLKMSGPDSVIVVMIVSAWAAYNWRVVLIAAAYPDLIDRPDSPVAKPRRRHPEFLEQDKDKDP